MNNKTIRKIMEMLYGKQCFIEKLGIRISGAKTLDHTLTLHHIIPIEKRWRNNNTKWSITCKI
jgi:hypothetical protein